MADDLELPRIPGIRAVSSFYSNFGGEDVVLRPSSPERDPFKIEVMLDRKGAIFPPSAAVREGDIVEREDPRGGVIEYRISRYEFNKDPFNLGTDHWVATLVEKGRASRSFAQPKIVVHGGTNQISVGNGNQLHQTNVTTEARGVIAALEEIRSSTPREDLSPAQVEEVDEAIEEAKAAASSGQKTSAIKRSLHAVRGVVEDVAESASAGAKDAVKVWSAAATTLIIKHLAGL